MRAVRKERPDHALGRDKAVSLLWETGVMKGDFKDATMPAIPPKGKVNTRIAIKTVPHGVNIHLQVRTLGEVTYTGVACAAIRGILAGCVREGLKTSHVKRVLDEAEKTYTGETVKLWDFDSDEGRPA